MLNLLVGLKVHNSNNTVSSYAYISDNVGNIVALVDKKGKLVNKYSYSPFGKQNIIKEDIAQDFGFNTKLHDDTGLVYYNNRYYNVDLGRFITRDPIREVGGNNLYSFVGNDPVNNIDRLGLDIIILQDKQGAGGYGHTAVLIGNELDGWHYYSADGEGVGGVDLDTNGIYYTTLNDFYNDVIPYDDNGDGVISPEELRPNSRYEEAVRIPRNHQQDAQAMVEASISVGSEYNCLFQNCNDVADDVLDDQGFNEPNSIIPNTWFDELKKLIENETIPGMILFIDENNIFIPVLFL